MVPGAVVHIVSSWLIGGAHVLDVLGEVLVLRHAVKIGQVLDRGGDLSEIRIVVFLLALFNSIITNLPLSSTLPERTKQMVVRATSTQLRQLLMQVHLILQQMFLRKKLLMKKLNWPSMLTPLSYSISLKS